MEEKGECHFHAPLGVHLTVSREYDHIRVSGRVTTTLSLNCARCLSEFRMEIDSPFTIFYMRDAGLGQDKDVELTEEDLVTATYEGDEIDLSSEIAEQIILSLPIKPLCSHDCKGLCPACGSDLNESPCSCNQESISLKFAALKNLKVRK